MELTALLCNHAEAQSNLLYVSGGGIDRALVPPNAPPPYGVALGIAINIEIPWTQTNQDHTLLITLVDADGNDVQLPTPTGATEPFRAEMHFTTGRPPSLEIGESQNFSLALNAPQLPFPRLGTYLFVIELDGTEVKRLNFRLAANPALTYSGPASSGPTSLPF